MCDNLITCTYVEKITSSEPGLLYFSSWLGSAEPRKLPAPPGLSFILRPLSFFPYPH